MTNESTDWGPNVVPPTPQDGTLAHSPKVANPPSNVDSSPNDTPYDTQTTPGYDDAELPAPEGSGR